MSLHLTTQTIKTDRNYLGYSVTFFTLSTVITWWFIIASPLYFSVQQQLLSCSIAGGKWALQLVAAWFFLRSKKWLFIYNISITCLVGSTILLPYCFSSFLFGLNNNTYFISSLIIAVIAMIVSYYFSVKRSGVSIIWWLGWLACLVVAVTLQLTVVFHVVGG